MHEIGKLHNLQYLRENYLKNETFLHKCISYYYKHFDIMLKAKFICLGYFMYNLYSCISTDFKIICTVSGYGIGKSQYGYEGVGYISLHCKGHNTRHLHMM